MRIVQVTHSFYPATGGIETHVLELSRELAKTDEVVVYTAGKRRSDRSLHGVRVREYPSFPVPFVPKLRISPWLAFDLLGETGDVYHSHGFFSPYPLCASIAARLKGKPFFFTFHGMPRPKNALLGAAMACYKAAAAPIYLSIAARIITVSSDVPDYLGQYAGKIAHVPNGVSRSFRCHGSFSGKNRITYVGRLAEDKRVGVLVKAFGLLPGKGMRLCICGEDYGAKGAIRQAAKEAGVDAKFIEADYRQMPFVYCSSKAIVLPSGYEGFPLVWLEALSCGRPVFSSRTGDYRLFFRDLFGRNAELFLFDGEAELAGKLGYFLENQEKFARLVSAAKRRIAKEYSWASVAGRTRGIFLSKKR